MSKQWEEMIHGFVGPGVYHLTVFCGTWQHTIHRRVILGGVSLCKAMNMATKVRPPFQARPSRTAPVPHVYEMFGKVVLGHVVHTGRR